MSVTQCGSKIISCPQSVLAIKSKRYCSTTVCLLLITKHQTKLATIADEHSSQAHLEIINVVHVECDKYLF